jgi:hypothetical protein
VEADDSFAENDDIHVDWLEVVFAVHVLLKGAVVDKVVISELLDLFKRLLHHNVFSGQRIDGKGLGYYPHLGICRRKNVKPKRRSRTVSLAHFLESFPPSCLSSRPLVFRRVPKTNEYQPVIPHQDLILVCHPIVS